MSEVLIFVTFWGYKGESGRLPSGTIQPHEECRQRHRQHGVMSSAERIVSTNKGTLARGSQKAPIRKSSLSPD